MARTKRSQQQRQQPKNPRETVYLNHVTADQLSLLCEKYPRRTKSDMINAAIEHLFLSGYEQGLDGNLLPLNPQVYKGYARQGGESRECQMVDEKGA